MNIEAFRNEVAILDRMQKGHRAVKLEGDDLVHITTDYEMKISYMLCGLRNDKRAMTETNDCPTCPKCTQSCLYALNKANSYTESGRIISQAYTNIFGADVCRKGKCRKLHRDIKKSSHNYPYIPNSCRSIAVALGNVFRIITKERNVTNAYDGTIPQLRFLDAGCGIGNIVTLAHAVGFVAHGIELNSEYLKHARKLTVNLYSKPYFECADIITFDRYHKYDLIYYYVPIQDPVLQAAFEIHLVRGMKVGTFMLPTGSHRVVEAAKTECYFKDHKTADYGRPTYEKVKKVPKDWVSEVKWLREDYTKYTKMVKDGYFSKKI